MHYTKPSYYDKFLCTAGDCPDTCCQAWQIIIDKDSMVKYRNDPLLLDYVRDSIDYDSCVEGPVYKLKDGKCIHLTRDGLCEMQLKFGFDSLCNVCRKYPRHEEEYDGERELSIDISCPEGAALVLGDEDGTFSYSEDDREEDGDYDDFDYFLYSELFDGRDRIFSILNDRGETSLSGLMSKILALGDYWQNCLDENRVSEMSEIDALDLYGFTFDKEKKLFSRLYEMEFLKPERLQIVKRTEEYVFSSEDRYESSCRELEKYSLYIKRLLRFMIYRYFGGAVYDDEIFARLAFSIFCSRWSFFVFLSDPERQKDETGQMVKSVYIFSREIEHSDTNISMLFDAFRGTR